MSESVPEAAGPEPPQEVTPEPVPEPAPDGGQPQGSAQARGLAAVNANPVTARVLKAMRGTRG